MEVKNCKECGRLYNYVSGPRLCPNCRQKLEEKFEQVKNYIYDNKNATITQISEENDVSVPQIKQWIREERLCFSADSVIGIECEKCGVTIKTGRFCEKCKKEMANDLENIYGHKPKSGVRQDSREKARMRFLDS